MKVVAGLVAVEALVVAADAHDDVVLHFDFDQGLAALALLKLVFFLVAVVVGLFLLLVCRLALRRDIQKWIHDKRNGAEFRELCLAERTVNFHLSDDFYSVRALVSRAFDEVRNRSCEAIDLPRVVGVDIGVVLKQALDVGVAHLLGAVCVWTSDRLMVGLQTGHHQPLHAFCVAHVVAGFQGESLSRELYAHLTLNVLQRLLKRDVLRLHPLDDSRRDLHGDVVQKHVSSADGAGNFLHHFLFVC